MTAVRNHKASAFLCVTAGLLLVCLMGYSEEPPESGMSAFGKMVPLGFVNRHVRIPSFSNGKASSIMTADTLTRIDDDRLQAGKTVVEILAERAQENIRVDLATAIFNMTDQILRSGDRSRVSRADFQMEGDAMVFDSRTSVGCMKGRVRTIIFDTSTLSGKSKGVAKSLN
jgi:hypothetical protein